MEKKILGIMKKYVFILFLITGFGLHAQELYKKFDPEAFTKDLTEKITGFLQIDDSATKQAVQKEVFSYAMSTQKMILAYEKKGLTENKTLEEVLKMVKKDAQRASQFRQSLARILGEERVNKLEELNIF